MEELDEFGIPIKKQSTVEVDEFGIPVKKKEVTPEEKGVQSTNDLQTVSPQGGEQPSGSGAKVSGFTGTITETAPEETASSQTELRQKVAKEMPKAGMKETPYFELSQKKNQAEAEAHKNYNLVETNNQFAQIKDLDTLYGLLKEAEQGRGVAGGSPEQIQKRIDEIRNSKVAMAEGVDQSGQVVSAKKSPYKTVGEMYDATAKAAEDYQAKAKEANDIKQQLDPLIDEARRRNEFKTTKKDGFGNQYKELNPIESFVNGFSGSTDAIEFGLQNLFGDKQAAIDGMKRKWVNDNVLYPQKPSGAVSTGFEMLGGVAPLIGAGAIAPEGIGALVANSLMFGAQDYGGKLYESFAEGKANGLDDDAAMKEAEKNAKFAGIKGAVLGATMPLQSMAGGKITGGLLGDAERSEFRKFLDGQVGMIPSFGASQAIQNWYEGKPIENGVAKSMVDAFIIGGMTHALATIPNLSAKVRDKFENTLAKNYGSIAQVFDAGVRDGAIDYATAQRIQERAKAYDVVGKDAPEKAVDKGIELNQVADEIAKRKETNPLADVTDLDHKAEELNKEIHEIKGTALTEKESKELDNLKGKEELTPTEKRKKKHYEKRIETAKQAEEVAKEETIKRQQEEEAAKLQEQKTEQDDSKTAERQISGEIGIGQEPVETQPIEEGSGGASSGGGILEKTQEVTPTEVATETFVGDGKTFITHNDEVVTGKKLTDAINKVADDMVESANKKRKGSYASHITENQKDEILSKDLKYAEEVRQGKHLNNLTVAQRVNYELTGESVPILPKVKAEPTEETAIFAEYNNARSDVGRDKAIAKLPKELQEKALDVVKNFEDYLGRFKKLKEEGKIEFETDC